MYIWLEICNCFNTKATDKYCSLNFISLLIDIDMKNIKHKGGGNTPINANLSDRERLNRALVRFYNLIHNTQDENEILDLYTEMSESLLDLSQDRNLIQEYSTILIYIYVDRLNELENDNNNDNESDNDSDEDRPDSPTSVIDIHSGEGINNYNLYKRAKQIADKTYKKPSAYKSGFIIKKYKELGGTFSGDKPKNIGIERWFKEKWVRVNPVVGNKTYPVYRPTKRINKDTPLTIDEIDPNNLRQQIDLKQIIKGNRNLPPFKKLGSGSYYNINNYTNPKIVFTKAKKIYGKDVNIKLSDKSNKKYMMLNPNTNKWFYFGQMGYEDFTKHKDNLRRERFKKRNHKWASYDKYTPSYASFYLLW